MKICNESNLNYKTHVRADRVHACSCTFFCTSEKNFSFFSSVFFWHPDSRVDI